MGFLDSIKKAFGFNASRCIDCDCDKFRKIVQDIIDGEASPEDERFFQEQINKCSCCKNHYNCEKDILNCVKEKMARKCCPDSLKDSIKAKLQ